MKDNRALVIGAGADLPDTVTDAKGLARILTDPARCAYPKANEALLTGKRAARKGILAALADLGRQATAESTVVVYFSGHGGYIGEGRSRRYFLLPYGHDTAPLAESAISGGEFAEGLAGIRAKRLLLLLDCCHAAGVASDRVKEPAPALVKSPIPPEARKLFREGQGRFIIASSKANEVSYPGRPYSLFTRALIECLGGAGVAREDGYVRVLDLALHAREMVPSWSKGRQTPVADIQRATDNWVVACYAAGAKSPRPLRLPPVDPDEVERRAVEAGILTEGQVHGGGAIAQGNDAIAVGAGGVVVVGDVHGSIITGSGNRASGAAVDDQAGAGSAQGQPDLSLQLYDVLAGRRFALGDLQDLAFRMGIAWDDLEGDARPAKARALVGYCQRHNKLKQLRQLIAELRPDVRL
jgi:hypothetical protein